MAMRKSWKWARPTHRPTSTPSPNLNLQTPPPTSTATPTPPAPGTGISAGATSTTSVWIPQPPKRITITQTLSDIFAGVRKGCGFVDLALPNELTGSNLSASDLFVAAGDTLVAVIGPNSTSQTLNKLGPLAAVGCFGYDVGYDNIKNTGPFNIDTEITLSTVVYAVIAVFIVIPILPP